MLGNGTPTRRQLLLAAIARLGPDAVITGVDALLAQGATLPIPRNVQVLVAAHRRVQPDEFMFVQRTTRLPAAVPYEGIPFAPAARATLDVARRETDPARLHRLLSQPLYWGLCTAEELRAELDAGNQRGSSGVRDALRHLNTGSDTFIYGLARRLLGRAPLPTPSWNVTVCDMLGRPIGLADAWWDEIGLAWQFCSRDESQSEPGLNHLALTAAGVAVVRCTTARLTDQPELVTRELVGAFAGAARRPRPKVQGFGLDMLPRVAA